MMIKKLLIADENEYIRKIIINKFETALDISHHFIFFEAKDGQEVLDIVGQEDIHVVIMDTNLPNINGFEVLRTIKRSSIKAHIPVILLSDNIHRSTRTKAYELGAVGVIQKPFAAKEIFLLVSSILKIQDEYLHINEVLRLFMFLKEVLNDQIVIVPKVIDGFLSTYFTSYKMLAIVKLKYDYELLYNKDFSEKETQYIMENIYDLSNLKNDYFIMDLKKNGNLLLLIFKISEDNKRFIILRNLLELWSDFND